ncbi:MAG: ChaB family protein [Dehalococcoidia bacterium]|nr:ChaB family protein [Dehalococcoidia bacterium]
MPKKRSELPATLKRSDTHAQDIFIETHESALETYDGDEERAHRAAYAAVKHSYKKQGDRWVKKARRGPSDEQAARGPNTSPRSYGDTPARTGGGRVVGEEQSRDELYERAKELDIPGRSKMNKEELAVAIHEYGPSTNTGSRRR